MNPGDPKSFVCRKLRHRPNETPSTPWMKSLQNAALSAVLGGAAGWATAGVASGPQRRAAAIIAVKGFNISLSVLKRLRTCRRLHLKSSCDRAAHPLAFRSELVRVRA